MAELSCTDSSFSVLAVRELSARETTAFACLNNIRKISLRVQVREPTANVDLNAGLLKACTGSKFCPSLRGYKGDNCKHGTSCQRTNDLSLKQVTQ